MAVLMAETLQQMQSMLGVEQNKGQQYGPEIKITECVWANPPGNS